MRIVRDQTRRLLLLAPLVLLALLAACGDQTTIDPKSDNTNEIHTVYVIVFWLAMFVFVAIMAITLILAVWYRERPGRVARQIHGNTRLEVLWTIIPIAIVVVMIVPSWRAIANTTDSPPEGSLEVRAIGKQWWFEFQYDLNDDGVFDDLITANELHIEVDQPVHIVLPSEDVIHSFWIPQLVGKVDMVPGHENDLWFTPNTASKEAYLGQCAEFCGTSHANMRFRVFVHDKAGFDAWVANETSAAIEPTSELGQQGKDVFLRSACIGCHTVNGTIAAGRIGPDLSHVGSRETIAAGIMDNSVENLVEWISNPSEVKPGMDPEDDTRFMPAFETVLSPDEIRQIAQYLTELK
ncbi:MAG: cytochrome c oxidase subunit II [Chloroflexi bacterium]|nr:cytochrome c oxidase subunit II [Chloroflexota bacterium]